MIEQGEFDFENRLVSPTEQPPDSTDDFEVGLRPKTLDEYIGQDSVKENIKICIEADKQRGDALDHVLLYGPHG